MNNYRDKKVLILGLGLNQGGVGSAKYFAFQGAKVRVTDLKGKRVLQPSIDKLKQFPGIGYTLGEHKFEDIDWADLIIKNPAVKPNNPYINYALKNNKPVKMDMDIFLENVKPSQIIGVTGTKGKSTTATLIYQVLKTVSKDVVLAGNIGVSVLDVIPFIKNDTLVVLEISSFQLESFDQNRVSPKWAVITNITPDHLNYYTKMNEYISAKKIIGKYQKNSDYLFLRKNDPITTKANFLKDFKGQIIFFSKDDLPAFKPYLKGEHNLENMAAAYQVGKTFGINSKLLLKTLSSFKGIPFRMELIKTWNGVKIINDTAATSPEASIKAIQTLASHIGSRNIVLICGGMNKRMDYTNYANIIDKHIKKVFFLEGDSTDAIILSLRAKPRQRRAKQSNPPTQGPYNDLEKLLTDVKSQVKPGDTILFSPASTSFNLFQNEFDRGRKFNQAVKKVF